MASYAARHAATKMRKMTKYIRKHPELVQSYGGLGSYPNVCVLGAMSEACGIEKTVFGDTVYPLREAPNVQEALIAANDGDLTDFDTFAHFVESCDFPTLADMLDSLTLPPNYGDTES